MQCKEGMVTQLDHLQDTGHWVILRGAIIQAAKRHIRTSLRGYTKERVRGQRSRHGITNEAAEEDTCRFQNFSFACHTTLYCLSGLTDGSSVFCYVSNDSFSLLALMKLLLCRVCLLAAVQVLDLVT